MIINLFWRIEFCLALVRKINKWTGFIMGLEPAVRNVSPCINEKITIFLFRGYIFRYSRYFLRLIYSIYF